MGDTDPRELRAKDKAKLETPAQLIKPPPGKCDRADKDSDQGQLAAWERSDTEIIAWGQVMSQGGPGLDTESLRD